MSEGPPDRSTDVAWEQWGARDPYFGVLSMPQFRRGQMTQEARREFFRSGETHVQYVLDYIRHFIDKKFVPEAALDFGCGVGRTLLPLAAAARQATGLDVSPSMLQEAQRNCEAADRKNVRLLLSDDELSALTGDFDLIHSCIVLQHIPIARGRAIFARLLGFLRPGGIAAVQVTYGRREFAANWGVPPVADRTSVPGEAPPASPGSNSDPEMQMNAYNIGELLFCVQESGVQRMHVDLTDHAGELGVFMFFRKPLSPLGPK